MHHSANLYSELEGQGCAATTPKGTGRKLVNPTEAPDAPLGVLSLVYSLVINIIDWLA